MNLEQTVFSTKQVIHQGSPIKFVSHDEDGDWQFLGDADLATEDGVVVSLGEIISIDPSIKELLSLPEGSEAHRTSVGNEWIITSRS